MEIVYRALANTSKAKDFSTKEECEEYERKNLPRMWSIFGTPTTDPTDSCFVEVLDDMTATRLRKLYPDENWKDLGANGLGIYRWDHILERYENIDFYSYEIVKTFIETNRDNIAEWL